MTNAEIYRRRILQLMLMSASPILAAAPFLIGIAGGNLTGCTQYDCPWSVLPWLSFLTAPAALILFIIALVLFLKELRTKLKKTEEATKQERRLRGYYFGWMVTAVGPLLLAIVLLLTIFGGPVSICDDAGCTETAQGVFTGEAIKIAPVLIALSWLYLFGMWVWNKVKKV